MAAARTGHRHSEPQPGETPKSFCCGARRLRSLQARFGAEPEPRPGCCQPGAAIPAQGQHHLGRGHAGAALPCRALGRAVPRPLAALTSKAVVDVGEAPAGAAACGVFSYLAFQQA